MTDYEIRTMKIIVSPKGSNSFDRTTTSVEIQDDGGGEFLEISQCDKDRQIIKIDPSEWSTIRDAIDCMIKECRDENKDN